jgi:hypothetical protein
MTEETSGLLTALETALIVVDGLVIAGAIHNFFRFVIGQEKYKDRHSGPKRISFYVLTIALEVLRIALIF